MRRALLRAWQRSIDDRTETVPVNVSSFRADLPWRIRHFFSPGEGERASSWSLRKYVRAVEGRELCISRIRVCIDDEQRCFHRRRKRGWCALPLSRFLFSTKCRAALRRFALRAKDNGGGEGGRKRGIGGEKEGGNGKEIYVPGAFSRATTLTAYKTFAKCVWVLRIRRPRRSRDQQ